MGRFTMFVALPLSLCLLAASCKDDVQCERARMDLTKSWSTLREAAARRMLDGVDTPAWKDVESKTELLESSFVTSQVTWDSAAKASQRCGGRVGRAKIATR